MLFQGSLVRYTSPGRMLSAPISLMKWPTEAAMVLTWPGVPVTACAIMRPERSNTPADRSPASRTDVENAVRTSVSACSSTTEIKRFHMICMGTSCWALDAVGLETLFRACRADLAILRVRSGWTTAVCRDPTTVVVWSSMIRAGPATVSPAESSLRSYRAEAAMAPVAGS